MFSNIIASIFLLPMHLGSGKWHVGYEFWQVEMAIIYYEYITNLSFSPN
jgi:hypothetical protein